MNPNEIELAAERLIRKIKGFLISNIGRTAEESNSDEFYHALCFAVREETMINWLATARTFAKQNVRMIYYLSMEYLPGRLLTNNITNLGSSEVIRLIMQRMNRNFLDIVNREADPGLGNGGLGRLASCLLDSMATQHYPAQGYGLRYQYGIFEQQLWEGTQVEVPDCWLLSENPWEFRRDSRRVHVKFCGTPQPSLNIHGDEIMELKDPEEVGALPYDYPIVGYSKTNDFSVVTLRLWSTKDSPRNFQLQRYNAGRLDQAAENTTLTDVLYPNDNTEVGKRVRLKQEFLLVSASLQDIIRHYLGHHSNFRQFADKIRIQINDTHPSLVIAELMRILIKDYDLPWKTAFEMTQTVTSYTNHTILNEALEQWDQHLFFYLLPRQYRIIERINQDFCNTIRTRFPKDEERVRRMSILQDGKVRMAHLAIIGSHKVNGVAQLHSEILKSVVFKDFYELTPDKFVNVTNGITQRRWLLECNPDLAKFITKCIGDAWITDFSKIKGLAQFASTPEVQDEFLVIKEKNKNRLIEFLSQHNPIRNSSGAIVDTLSLINSKSLFDVQVKRIHEYKRQLMNALHLIMVYYDIIQNKETTRVPRTAIIGGKAASSYETAKDIIKLFYCIARKINHDPAVMGLLRIVYVENYNVTRAEIVIPAADLSEQISTAGTEASGTGNMKLAINGALTIGTRDGANIEMEKQITSKWFPLVFGASTEEITALRDSNQYCSRTLYEANPKIKQAVDSLRNRTFTQNEEEHLILSDLYHKLIEGHYGGVPDRYFSILDLQSFYETQLKAEDLFKNPRRWAEISLHNIAGMGEFSIDRSVDKYADLIWNIQKCPINRELLDRVRYDYAVNTKG